jgi:hypothetical protein
LLALGLLLVRPAATSAAPATVTQDTPFDNELFVPCLGETVHIFGTIHTVDQFFVLSNGRLHVEHTDVGRDITAIGETSGAVYHAPASPDNLTFNIQTANGAGSFAFTNRQLLITQGGSPNVVLKENAHAELTPGGKFVVNFDSFSIDCRG